MPTPTGLPKVGERWAFSQSLPPDWKRVWRYGTVMARGRGDYFALYIRWDDGKGRGSHMGRDIDMMVDAAYHLSMGNLKVVA